MPAGASFYGNIWDIDTECRALLSDFSPANAKIWTYVVALGTVDDKTGAAHSNLTTFPPEN